jgi:hypothetical protein
MEWRFTPAVETDFEAQGIVCWFVSTKNFAWRHFEVTEGLPFIAGSVNVHSG